VEEKRRNEEEAKALEFAYRLVFGKNLLAVSMLEMKQQVLTENLSA
jgi:hypothetical protein